MTGKRRIMGPGLLYSVGCKGKLRLYRPLLCSEEAVKIGRSIICNVSNLAQPPTIHSLF